MTANAGSVTADNPAQAPSAKRILSIDLLRGIIMVVMALDHTRDYFTNIRFLPEDLSQTFAALFFTRWITHFCAPGFFFLAGTGIYFSSRRKSTGEVGNFLWKRGLWLVLAELTIIGFGWTFVPGLSFAQTIWALGWSMVAMALLVRLPIRGVAVFAALMIGMHNLLDPIQAASFGKGFWVWNILHQSGFIPIAADFLPKGFGFFVAYPLIPWIGVMAAGFAFGHMYTRTRESRQRAMLILGALMIISFLFLRVSNLYGNPAAGFVPSGDFAVQATMEKTVISLLNTQKYPPSLQFLLMTLGPLILLLAWFDRFDLKSQLGKTLGRWLVVFGQVPMFFYILHIYLIHLLTIPVAMLFGQPWKWLAFGAFFLNPIPENYGHGLPMVYFFWVVVCVMLYLPCRWYARYKATHSQWWLSYL